MPGRRDRALWWRGRPPDNEDAAVDRGEGVLELRDRREASAVRMTVDLSASEFIDSSVLRTMLDKQERLERDGQRLELLVPADRRNVTRVLAISEVGRLVRVHVTLPPSEPEPSS